MGQVESLRTENKFKKTEIGEIPVDWKVVIIREISRICRGASPRPIGNPKYFGDGPGWVRISDVTKANIYLRETKDHLSDLGVSKSIIVKPGNLILSICATIGKPVIIDMDACIHDGFVLFDDLSNQVNVLYLFYWLQKNESYFSNQGQHGTQKNLNTGIIKNTTIPLPPLPEQKKIAEILTSIDETIEKKQEIIEKTKMLKKGLMQELLARGIGHKKFQKTEIGEIPVDWEVYCLGDYAYIKARIGWRGLSASEYTDEGPLLIAGNHIKRTKILWDKCDHISQYRYDESPEIKLKNGDIILSKDGTIGRLGFIERLPQEATIGGTMMMIRPDENLFFSKFVYFYFQGEYFQKLIKEKISGSSIPHIFQRDIVNLKIPFLLLPEQIKIAEILTAVDEKIEKEMAQKERIENIKKGLMQVLLTGKIRAKI